MKIVLESSEDVKAINWLNVKERIIQEVADKIVDALKDATRQLQELQPGEERKIDINIGSIVISKEADQMQTA